jgi:endogenous inhibitor of DNA gyrase (YacG/DUF329 family)
MAEVTDIREAKKVRQRQGKRGCAICGKPVAAAYRPFCSERCAQIDLGRWFGGHYRIETEDGPEGERLPDADGEDLG